ncbi:MAG TPA: class I SAM-dependent methyltransferase [Pilimelia sp.]|nr:class I SAM-dependent methyltransferase [Pilimelia sp.]
MADRTSPAYGAEPHYLPAMGRRWLLPLYDPFTRLAGISRVHGELLDRADVRPGQRVVEIGSGTGNLLLLAARRHPEAELIGLDPDPAGLARTARKAARARLTVRLERGFAGALPFPDASVDRVLSAFMLHHLAPAEKERALAEVRRVLRPGGQFHAVDMDGHGSHHGPAGWFARRSHRLADNGPDRLLEALHRAGLANAAHTGTAKTPLTHPAFYTATAPTQPPGTPA